MSTTDYLKTLDYDQLKFCRERCDETIRAICGRVETTRMVDHEVKE